MSKYVIELDEDVKILQSISVTPNGNAYTNTQWIADIEELNSDYINEHFGDLQDEAYKRGLEEGKAQSERGCEGCTYQDNTVEHHPCGVCCNAYKNQWTAKDDKIKVGDEVEHTVSGYTSKAIFLDLEKIKDDEDWYECLF